MLHTCPKSGKKYIGRRISPHLGNSAAFSSEMMETKGGGKGRSDIARQACYRKREAVTHSQEARNVSLNLNTATLGQKVGQCISLFIGERTGLRKRNGLPAVNIAPGFMGQEGFWHPRSKCWRETDGARREEEEGGGRPRPLLAQQQQQQQQLLLLPQRTTTTAVAITRVILTFRKIFGLCSQMNSPTTI